MFNVPDVKSARILIVDDQPANIQLLQRLLATSGYTQVSASATPHEVSGLHRQHDFDLILLDLQMPGMDGFEVLAALHAQQQDGYVPVIVLTAQPALKLKALQAGARDFISKPFDLVEVTTRIHNMLEVRLLYRELARYNEVLEETVRARTAELRLSEERYRRLTGLASDWHWEQDAEGRMLAFEGPAEELAGLMTGPSPAAEPVGSAVWDGPRHAVLQALLQDRQPFIDFIISRTHAGGERQHFRISGEPIFSPSMRFSGYRCTGVRFVPVSMLDGDGA